MKTIIKSGYLSMLIAASFPASAANIVDEIMNNHYWQTAQPAAKNVPATAAAPVAQPERLSTQATCPTGAPVLTHLTLGGAINIALCNSPRLRAAWLQTKFSETEELRRIGAWLPEINATATQRRGDQKSVYGNEVYEFRQQYKPKVKDLAVNVDWLLFDFGKRENEYFRAEESLAAARALNSVEFQQVTLDVAQKYYALVYLQTLVEMAYEQERIASEVMQDATARHRAGIVPLTDKIQAENSLGQATMSRIQYESDIARAKGDLLTVMGVAANLTMNLADKRLSMPDGALAASVTDYIHQALLNNPAVKAAEHQKNADVYGKNAAGLSMLPSLSFVGSYGRTDSRDAIVTAPTRNDELWMGLQVKIPLFNRLQQYSQQIDAQNNIQLRENALRDKQLEVTSAIWSNFHAMSASTENALKSEQVLKNTQLAHKLARGRYRSGMGSMLEVLSTQQSWMNAVSQNVNTLTQWHQSRLTLLILTGGFNRLQDINNKASTAAYK
ncbi:TolC family protein [Enterobacteriaceae bacterium C23F]